MAKLTQLEHRSSSEISRQLTSPRLSDWIQVIIRCLLWFLKLPWMVLSLAWFFTSGKSIECGAEMKEGRGIGVDSGEGNIDDNADDSTQHGDHDRDADEQSDLGGLIKRMSNQLYRRTTLHVDMNVFPGMTATSTTATAPFDYLFRISPFQSPCQATYKPSKNYETIMNQLVWLEDNGEFETFDQLSSIILSCYGNSDPEITTAVLIEQSRCMFYSNRVPLAKFLAKKALKLSSSTASPRMFVARASLVISACHRRQGKLGKANLYLEQAEQSLVNTCYYEDWCRFYDEYGSYLNSIIDTVSSPSTELYKTAKESFHKQFQAACRLSRARVREKNQFYALLKTARTLLDANTLFGRQRQIPVSDIQLACECLDKIENKLWESVPRGTHIQFLVIRCKQYYREMRYQEAFKLLEKCHKMAKARGYERDLALIVDGAEQIKTLMHIEKKLTTTSVDDLKNSREEDRKNSSSGKESELRDSTDAIDIFGSELGDSN